MEQNVKSAVRTVPNQKVIVNKVVVSGRFFQVDEATFTAGCRDLKPTTFLVWQALNLQYFAADKELALSTQQICTIMGGMRLNTVKDAIKELIEKGWLVLVAGNHYELVNPVGRKAPYDVVRKAPYAWGEKRPTGGAKSALEIIREKEYNNNSNNNIESLPKNGSSDFRNSEVALPKIGSSTSEIRDTNTTYITNTTINTTYIGSEPEYVSEDDYNQETIKRNNSNFDESYLPF